MRGAFSLETPLTAPDRADRMEMPGQMPPLMKTEDAGLIPKKYLFFFPLHGYRFLGALAGAYPAALAEIEVDL